MSWTWSAANESSPCDLHDTCLLSQVNTHEREGKAAEIERLIGPIQSTVMIQWVVERSAEDCRALWSYLCLCAACVSLHKAQSNSGPAAFGCEGLRAPQRWHWLRTQMTLKSIKQSPALFLKFKQSGFSQGTKLIWQSREKNLTFKIKIPP